MPNPELSELSGFLDAIGEWDGFEVAHVTMEDALEPDALGLPARRLVIELRAKPGAPKRCSRCGELKSSSAWPTVTETTRTSFSRSERLFPVFRDEPTFGMSVL